MKNILTTIYITIFSILICTVLFTIAELNMAAKTEFSNHLERSVILCASYFLLCKLIIQIAITSIIGNILYNKIVNIRDTKDIFVDNTSLWGKYPDKMKPHKDRLENLGDIKSDKSRIDKKVSGVDNIMKRPINEEIYNKVGELKFDPIDQIDELDKNGIEEEEEEYIPLKEILTSMLVEGYSFTIKDIKENKRWKLIKDVDVSDFTKYERVLVGDKTLYYVVED